MFPMKYDHRPRCHFMKTSVKSESNCPPRWKWKLRWNFFYEIEIWGRDWMKSVKSGGSTRPFTISIYHRCCVHWQNPGEKNPQKDKDSVDVFHELKSTEPFNEKINSMVALLFIRYDYLHLSHWRQWIEKKNHHNLSIYSILTIKIRGDLRAFSQISVWLMNLNHCEWLIETHQTHDQKCIRAYIRLETKLRRIL